VRLAVPSIVESLLQSMVYLIDALMLARVGELELAAVSLTGIFLWRLTEIVGCIQKGTSAFVARRWGEGRFGDARRAATHGVTLAIVLGLTAATFVFPFLGWVFKSLGGEDQVLPVAVGYASMVLLAFPFTQMFINLSSSLRASGDTRTPALATILINICNVFLNYVLIFGKFGFPRLGMVGAGIATGLALFIGWAFLMSMTVRGLHPRSLFHAPYPVYGETDDSEKAIEAGGVAALDTMPPPPRRVDTHPAGDVRPPFKDLRLDDSSPNTRTSPSSDQSDLTDRTDDLRSAPTPKSASISPGPTYSALSTAPPSARGAGEKGVFRFVRSGLRLWIPEVTPTVLRVTAPTVVEEIFVSAGFLTFFWMLAQSGTTAMAAHSAVVRIESLSYMLSVGFTVSASTMVGQALGRGDAAMARRVFWLCALFAMTLMGSLGIVFALVPGWLLGWFAKGQGFLDIAVPLLLIASIEQPMMGAAATLSGGLRGAGDTVSPTISQFFGTLGVRVGIGYFLAFHLGLGIQGVYWGTLIDWTVRASILTVFVLRGRWKTVRV